MSDMSRSPKQNDKIPAPSPQDKTGASRDDFDQAREERLTRLDALRQAAFQRKRLLPSPEAIARRRSRLNFAKWALPGFAGFLLISIVAWPEITHLIHQDSAILREMRKLHFETGRMELAVYHNIDSHNNPYTLTTLYAHQINDNRINLVQPVADILLNGKNWLHITADTGVYLQHEQTLNLNGHVVLYRNDGLLMNSPTMDMDLRENIIATHDWVHAEGPSGTQDALGAFLDEDAGILEFLGPGLTVYFNDITRKEQPAGTEFSERQMQGRNIQRLTPSQTAP